LNTTLFLYCQQINIYQSSAGEHAGLVLNFKMVWLDFLNAWLLFAESVQFCNLC
jgi:hypothetical protein